MKNIISLHRTFTRNLSLSSRSLLRITDAIHPANYMKHALPKVKQDRRSKVEFAAQAPCLLTSAVPILLLSLDSNIQFIISITTLSRAIVVFQLLYIPISTPRSSPQGQHHIYVTYKIIYYIPFHSMVNKQETRSALLPASLAAPSSLSSPTTMIISIRNQSN